MGPRVLKRLWGRAGSQGSGRRPQDNPHRGAAISSRHGHGPPRLPRFPGTPGTYFGCRSWSGQGPAFLTSSQACRAAGRRERTHGFGTLPPCRSQVSRLPCLQAQLAHLGGGMMTRSIYLTGWLLQIGNRMRPVSHQPAGHVSGHHHRCRDCLAPNPLCLLFCSHLPSHSWKVLPLGLAS